MTVSVQDPGDLGKHFSDIHQLTDVLVLRTKAALLKLCKMYLYIIKKAHTDHSRLQKREEKRREELGVFIGLSFSIY